MKWGRAGQSLVEVVVAAGIIGMAAVVLVSAVTRAKANNRMAKERIVATRLAQEGWEWLQQQAGDDWEGLFMQVITDDGDSNNNVIYCLNDSGGTVAAWEKEIGVNLAAGPCGGTTFALSGANYQREIQLIYQESPTDQLKAKITVGWYSRGKNQTVLVEGTLNN